MGALCNQSPNISGKNGEVLVSSITSTQRRRLRDERIPSETMVRLRRGHWTITRAAPRRCYAEAALRLRRLDRRRGNLGATIVIMTQLQWISPCFRTVTVTIWTKPVTCRQSSFSATGRNAWEGSYYRFLFYCIYNL